MKETNENYSLPSLIGSPKQSMKDFYQDYPFTLDMENFQNVSDSLNKYVEKNLQWNFDRVLTPEENKMALDCLERKTGMKALYFERTGSKEL